MVKYSSPESQGFRNVSKGEYQVIFDSQPFTQWNFEVQAANPAGTSYWSRPEGTQTLSACRNSRVIQRLHLPYLAPGAVSDLVVYPLSSDSVQLSWRPPVNPNGQISGYEVTYQLISR